MNLSAHMLARIESVAILRRKGLSDAAIADQLGVPEHAIDHYATLNRPREHPPKPAATPAWQSRADCKNVPAETFFLKRYPARHPDVEAAKAICRACPVLDNCRAYTLAHPWRTSEGIWAAMTPSERRRARKATDERTAA